jgi:hypothetical protein
MITDAQRKLIHLARRRLGLTEGDYRALLQRVAGVASSNDLDGDAGVNAVMLEFGRLGFKTVQKAPQYGDRWGWATPKQLDLIRSLWRKYAGTEDEKGLEHFLEKQFKVTSLRFLDFKTAQKVITTFKRMAEWRRDHPRDKKQPARP